MFLTRLQKLEKQFVDLEQQLTDPEVIRDQELYQKYRKEHAEIAPLVLTFRRYQQVQKELAASQSLLKDETDEEMKAMAKEDIQSLKEQAAALEEELEYLLLPNTKTTYFLPRWNSASGLIIKEFGTRSTRTRTLALMPGRKRESS